MKKVQKPTIWDDDADIVFARKQMAEGKRLRDDGRAVRRVIREAKKVKL